MDFCILNFEGVSENEGGRIITAPVDIPRNPSHNLHGHAPTKHFFAVHNT